MAFKKRLGVFVKVPEPGKVKTRLVPPLTNEDACRLYSAFLRDLFYRIGKFKNVRGTAFYAGEASSTLTDIIPDGYELTPQRGASLGQRLQSAFATLLEDGNQSAVVIGSDSPDIPIRFLKRAFLKLKHKDVVLGPACDGGYYLIGLKAPAPELFVDIDWGGQTVFQRTVERVRQSGLSFSLMPLWYDVDTQASLQMLSNMIRARRLEHSDRLPATEAVLNDILQWEA